MEEKTSAPSDPHQSPAPTPLPTHRAPPPPTTWLPRPILSIAVLVIVLAVTFLSMNAVVRYFMGGEILPGICPQDSLCVSIVSHEKSPRHDEWIQALDEALADQKLGAIPLDWVGERNSNSDIVYINWITLTPNQSLDCEPNMFPSWRERHKYSQEADTVTANMSDRNESGSELASFAKKLDQLTMLDERLERSSIVVCMSRLATGRDVSLIVHPRINEKRPPAFQFPRTQIQLKQRLASTRKTAEQRAYEVVEDAVAVQKGEKPSERSMDFAPPDSELVALIGAAIRYVHGVQLSNIGENDDLLRVLQEIGALQVLQSNNETTEDDDQEFIDTVIGEYKRATDSPIDSSNRLKTQRRLKIVAHLGTFMQQLLREGLEGGEREILMNKIHANLGGQQRSSYRLLLQPAMARCMLAREFGETPTRTLVEPLARAFLVDYKNKNGTAGMKKAEPAWRIGALFNNAPSHEDCVALSYKLTRSYLSKSGTLSHEFCTWEPSYLELDALDEAMIEFCIEPITTILNFGWEEERFKQLFPEEDDRWSNRAVSLLASIARSVSVTEHSKEYKKLVQNGPDDLALIVPLAAMLSLELHNPGGFNRINSKKYRKTMIPLISAALKRYGQGTGTSRNSVVSMYFALYRYGELQMKKPPSYSSSWTYFSKHIAKLTTDDQDSMRHIVLSLLLGQWSTGDYDQEELVQTLEELALNNEDPPTEVGERSLWLLKQHVTKLAASLITDVSSDWDENPTSEEELEELDWSIPVLLPFHEDKWISKNCMRGLFEGVRNVRDLDEEWSQIHQATRDCQAEFEHDETEELE